MDVNYNRLDRQPMDVSKATGNAVAVSIELGDVCGPVHSKRKTE